MAGKSQRQNKPDTTDPDAALARVIRWVEEDLQIRCQRKVPGQLEFVGALDNPFVTQARAVGPCGWIGPAGTDGPDLIRDKTFGDC